MSTERQRGKPDHCMVIEAGKEVALQLHPGAQVLVRWDAADRNEIERVAQPAPGTLSAKTANEKVWLIRAMDICAVGVAGE